MRVLNSKTAKKFLSISLTCILLLTINGCGSESQMDSECKKAYEENQQAYDYTGDLPEECRID
jgi:hypothetical protein